VSKAKKPIAPEVLEFAKSHNAKVVFWDPNKLAGFLLGTLTLGDLHGTKKDEQYKMASAGFNLIKNGKLDDAKKIFEGLKVLDPYDAFFHLALGSITQQQGDFEAAKKHYSRALEINQALVSAYSNRGEVHLLEGNIAAALADFLKAVQHDKDGKNPHSSRARILAGLFRERIAQARKAAG
jgi:Flp pilus assembly protein TadD